MNTDFLTYTTDTDQYHYNQYANYNSIVKLIEKTKCINCNDIDHQFKKCNLPINSFGIIYFRFNPEFEILMVQRKHTISFIDFIRGNYNPNYFNIMVDMFNTMTIEEKNMLLHESFETIWQIIWTNKIFNQNSSDYKFASRKYNFIQNEFEYNGYKWNVETFILRSTKSIDLEWCIPKGRRNKNENNISCAIREFYEETNIYLDHNKLIQEPNNAINNFESKFHPIFNYHTYQPITYNEEFISNNNICYRYTYFLYESKHHSSDFTNKLKIENKFQRVEISNIKWMNMDDLKEHLFPHDFKRYHLINKIKNDIINKLNN